MTTISLKQNEFKGIYVAIVEIRDSAKLQRTTGLSYLDCISLINKMDKKSVMF